MDSAAQELAPGTAQDVAELLKEYSSNKESISICGHNSKRGMGGPIVPTDHIISTRGLRRIVTYEPRDLTIGVEAGYPFAELQRLLAKEGQMIALDPSFEEQATVGGVVAANMSGPMRAGFGSARDLVIGMAFATLRGKVAQSGGMVVKNVAGLDISKLMIGSFGTLGAMTSINFRLHSKPEETNSFLFAYPELEGAMQRRDAIRRSALRPLAMDILSPGTALRFAQRGYVLALRAGGSEGILRRYRDELKGCEPLTGVDDRSFWEHVREFPADFLGRHPEGIVVRVSTTIGALSGIPKTVSGTFISRAAQGITHFYFPSWTAAARWWRKIGELRFPCAIEFAPEDVRGTEELWPVPEAGPERQAFVMMEKIKQMFDPDHILNRNRLYGRI
jgi:glycolate oxidase FAD binding subunit